MLTVFSTSPCEHNDIEGSRPVYLHNSGTLEEIREINAAVSQWVHTDHMELVYVTFTEYIPVFER